MGQLTAKSILEIDENVKPKYQVGDEVTYINDYCVNWGLRTITGMEQDKWGWSYYITPTETPWFPIREKNLYAPGTEPSFDLELNNGMVLPLVSTDDNANRYYAIEGKRVVLVDGKLHSVGGGWDEPGFPIDEQYQPKIQKTDISNEKVKKAVVDLLSQYSVDEVLNGNSWFGSSVPIEDVSEYGIDVNVCMSDENDPESLYSIIAYPLIPTEDDNYTADVSETLFTDSISKSELMLLVTSEKAVEKKGEDYFAPRNTDKSSVSRTLAPKR